MLNLERINQYIPYIQTPDDDPISFMIIQRFKNIYSK